IPSGEAKGGEVIEALMRQFSMNPVSVGTEEIEPKFSRKTQHRIGTSLPWQDFGKYLETLPLRDTFGSLTEKEKRELAAAGDIWTLKAIDPQTRQPVKADPQTRYPVIVGPDGGVLDGTRRITEAINRGDKAILAWVASDFSEQGMPLFQRGQGGNGESSAYNEDNADPADVRAVARLNDVLRDYFGNDRYGMVLHQGGETDLSRAYQEAFRAAFGKRIVFVEPAAGSKDPFNGFSISGEHGAVFVNARSNVGFIQVAGHELYHEIERTRPDLIAWYREQARRYIRDLPAYRDRLNALLEAGEQAYTDRTAENELLADFMGDALADPSFLQHLADSNPGKFQRFVNAVRLWLAKVANRLRGLKSSQYITDVEALQKHLSQVLNAYAEGKRIDGITPPRFLRQAAITERDTPLTTLFKQIAGLGDVFRYPKSDKADMKAIAEEVEPEIYTDGPIESAYSDRYSFWTLVSRDGRTIAVEADKQRKEIWINAAELESGRS
ncbi:MAG: hypothetical protein IT190_08990, partial [Microbacteriaceae bacterium]|nr:hypothetical protein [Microbacteriaceae bacterium]